jgi:hypothetical protein
MGVWGSCDAAKGPQPLLSLPLLLPQLRPDASAVLGFQTMSLPPCFPGSPLPLPAGRVPAGNNGIVGIKPSVGRFSTTGVVPACYLLDCPSVFALSVEDGAEVARFMENADISGE